MADKETETIKKHPLAIAWDAWLASDEGRTARDISTLPHYTDRYLENRLRNAFMAGAKSSDLEQLAALRVAAARAADWVEIQTAPCQHSDQPMRCTRCATRIKARELVAALREALNKGEKS